MSCVACDKGQGIDLENPITYMVNATYVRIGNGNVLIAGCKKHLEELIRLYRKAMETEP